ASAKDKTPAATSAEYSPSECPATKLGVTPFSASTRCAAIETVKIAGCVNSVSLSCSSGPSKQSFESEKPRASSASSKVCFAMENFSDKSRPMPTACEPCPGNRNASLVMQKVL